MAVKCPPSKSLSETKPNPRSSLRRGVGGGTSLWITSCGFLFVSLYSLAYLGFVRFDFLRWKAVHKLDVRHGAAAVDVVPDTIVDIALFAHDHWKVGEVRTVLALVSVFWDILTVFEQFYGCVAARHFARVFNWQSCLHFVLHEGTLAQLKVGILRVFGQQDSPRWWVNPHRI